MEDDQPFVPDEDLFAADTEYSTKKPSPRDTRDDTSENPVQMDGTDISRLSESQCAGSANISNREKKGTDSEEVLPSKKNIERVLETDSRSWKSVDNQVNIADGFISSKMTRVRFLNQLNIILKSLKLS